MPPKQSQNKSKGGFLGWRAITNEKLKLQKRNRMHELANRGLTALTTKETHELRRLYLSKQHSKWTRTNVQSFESSLERLPDEKPSQSTRKIFAKEWKKNIREMVLDGRIFVVELVLDCIDWIQKLML